MGWQWVFIAWGLPATLLGVVVFFLLTDRPRHAKWLTPEERDALEGELEREKAATVAKHRMTLRRGAAQPEGAAARPRATSSSSAGNYGLEFFFPSILKSWYGLKMNDITTYMMIGPVVAIAGQLFVGWSSDRTRERRLHAVIPIVIGALALLGAGPEPGQPRPSRSPASRSRRAARRPISRRSGRCPACSSRRRRPRAASASSIRSATLGGGGIGTPLMGYLKEHTGSYVTGLVVLSVSMLVAAAIIFFLGLGKKATSYRILIRGPPASAGPKRQSSDWSRER